MQELVHQMTRYGVPLVFVNVLLEQLGLPIPAVPGLVVAGALAADGKLPLLAVIFAALVASVAADSVWFFLGRKKGAAILKTVCRVSLSPDSCVRQTEQLFDRWGLTALLFAKFIPGFSTVAPPLAGSAGTPLWQFLLYDAGGSLLWAGSAIAAGMVFHGAIDQVLAFLTRIGSISVVLVTAAFALFVLVKWVQRRQLYKFLRTARITVEELQELIQNGDEPVVVDVRSPGARKRDGRRIPGARVFDTVELERSTPDLPADREIILYCT